MLNRGGIAIDAPTRTVFDVVTDFLANQPTDEEVLAYEIPPELQARLDALLEIGTTSRLTAAHRDELADFRFVEDVMTRVKANITQRLEQEQNDTGGNASSDDAVEQEENES